MEGLWNYLAQIKKHPFVFSFSVTSAPLTAAQLKSPPLSQPTPLVAMTTQGSINSLLVKDGLSPYTKSAVTSATLLQPQKITTSNASVPSSMTFPYYVTPQSVLVASLMTPVGLQASSAASSVVPAALLGAVSSSAPSTSASSLITLKADKTVDAPKQFVIQNSSAIKTPNNLVSLAVGSTAVKSVPAVSSVTSASGTSSVPIRQVFAPSLLPGQLAWPLLTLPRSPVIVPTSTIASSPATVSMATVSTSGGQVTSHPLVSLANLNQLTRMMTPMTVMSPGIQVAPTALTQAQLNGVFGSPLLKQLQLPLGIQTVLGQQMMKPVVVVTVPSVVTTSSSLLSNMSVVTSSL